MNASDFLLLIYKDLKISSHIFPLGDAALTLDLGNVIDPGINKIVVAVAQWMNKRGFAGVRDIIVAYSSVSVFYDPFVARSREPHWSGSIYDLMRMRLEEGLGSVDLDGLSSGAAEIQPRDNPVIRIPVCYGAAYAPDLSELAAAMGLSVDAVIDRHIRRTYRVYMIGFLPGFPYMGTVDPGIAMRRKERPVPVAAGSVGIAGDQTGIYPLNSPGGWQIIGRTPIKLFDAHSSVPAYLRPGDLVEFYAIGADEFLAIASVSNSKPLKKNDDRCQ